MFKTVLIGLVKLLALAVVVFAVVGAMFAGSKLAGVVVLVFIGFCALAIAAGVLHALCPRCRR
jgi:hypothetical protein